jgi:hypothetical protein
VGGRAHHGAAPWVLLQALLLPLLPLPPLPPLLLLALLLVRVLLL